VPYLPFAPGDQRPRLGLMALDPARWLEAGTDLAEVLAAKAAVRAAHPDASFAALAGSEAAGAEALRLLADNAATHHPDAYALDGDRLNVRATGAAVDLAPDSEHGLALAGRVLAEDLCLMQTEGNAPHRLTAGSVCFPSRWRLADKLGRPLAAIHTPVPFYAERLEAAVDRFFRHLKPGNGVWRLNWTLHDTPALYEPAAPPPRALTAAEVGQGLYLRVERQTLRRLPETDAVLFTIRTYMTALKDAIETPETAADLAAAVATLPPATLAYKGLAPYREVVLAWCARRVG